MKIFKEGKNVRLQLKDLKKDTWLFNFTVPLEHYEELRKHVTKALFDKPIEELNK